MPESPIASSDHPEWAIPARLTRGSPDWHVTIFNSAMGIVVIENLGLGAAVISTTVLIHTVGLIGVTHLMKYVRAWFRLHRHDAGLLADDLLYHRLRRRGAAARLASAVSPRRDQWPASDRLVHRLSRGGVTPWPPSGR